MDIQRGLKTSGRRGKRGQATLELALTIALFMSVVLFFMQLCFLFAYGNLVHYATFMSARAFLSAGQTSDDQAERAKSVVKKLLKRSGSSSVERYRFIAQGEGGDGDVTGLSLGPGAVFQPYDSRLSWQMGSRYSFRASLPMIPLSGGTRGANKLTLTSESWLGREKTEEECLSSMRTRGGGYLDNGC